MQTRKAIIILQSEVEKGIKEIREKKAAGNDDTPVSYTQSDVTDGLRIMTQLINNLHETGQWPKESAEVSDCIKEETKATKCSNQCTISIMVQQR
jgi:hypothetical protein